MNKLAEFLCLFAGYNPNQPRDHTGKWAKSGQSKADKAKARSAARKAARAAKARSSGSGGSGGGGGRGSGIKVHAIKAKTVKGRGGTSAQRSKLASTIKDARKTASSRDRKSEIAQSARAMRAYRRGQERPGPRERGGSRPAPPEYGHSKAAVSVAKPDRRQIESFSKKMFGRVLKSHEWASIGGAPHDSKVTVRPNSEGGIEVRWRSNKAYAIRTVYGQGGANPLIHNDAFEVKPKHQGKGLGSEVFGRQIENARKLGIKSIDTHAAKGNGYNGYHVWPRLGYDAQIPAELRSKLPGGLSNSKNLSDVMKSSEGRDWWKANGVGMQMAFDLNPNSASSRAWNQYRMESQR